MQHRNCTTERQNPRISGFIGGYYCDRETPTRRGTSSCLLLFLWPLFVGIGDLLAYSSLFAPTDSRWHLWRMLIMPADSATYAAAPRIPSGAREPARDVGRGHAVETLTLAKILIRFIQFLIHGVSAVAVCRYLWPKSELIS